ncbi:MAG: DUF5683 domain-containing protein [Candidatus Eiseniibacteriota bacterium]
MKRPSSGSLICALALAGCAALCTRVAAEPSSPGTNERTILAAAAPFDLPIPARIADPALDRVPALVTGDERPMLIYAQRTIDRGMGGTPVPPETPYREVEVDGWKSPGLATGMSAVIPGTGQLYSGSSRGYLYLGVEAIALASLAAFSSKENDTRDDYFTYVGDPNQTTSRFSFERLAGTVGPAEVQRLKTIYERDEREFYDTVTLDNSYSSGWANPNDRFNANDLAEETDRYARKANTGLYVLIANHIVSAVDALNLARLNNIALKDDLTLKLKLRPGLRHHSYGISVTQKF